MDFHRPVPWVQLKFIPTINTKKKSKKKKIKRKEYEKEEKFEVKSCRLHASYTNNILFIYFLTVYHIHYIYGMYIMIYRPSKQLYPYVFLHSPTS